MADIVLTATIPPDRRLVIDLPPEVAEGEVKIVISPLADTGHAPLPIRELLKSDVVGMWADREDMADSAAYVARMRREEEERRATW